MVELISIPLKKPSDVDLSKPLKNLINANNTYTDAINEFNKQRSTAIWKAFEKFESSLEILYG